MRKRFLELLTDPLTGRMSHTRLWSNVANLAATVAFVYHNFTHEPSAELWVIYLSACAGHAAWNKYIDLRFQAQTKKDPE